MEHSELVASELNNAGFETKVIRNKVIVTLKNRKPSEMEVETALEQIFGEIEFYLTSLSDSVLVTT